MKRTLTIGGIAVAVMIAIVGWALVSGRSQATAERSPYAGACSADGIEYRPQYSASQLSKIFGAPGSPQLTADLVTTTVLGQPVKVHRLVAACLDAVERERVALGISYPIDTADQLGGIGGYRASDGQLGAASYHVYGAAIDINPSQNPYCRGSRSVDPRGRCALDNPSTIPPALIEVFKRHGFTWGGDWRRQPDYMHFEWHGVPSP